MKSRHGDISPAALSRVAAATAEAGTGQPDVLPRARAFALPLIAGGELDTGENVLAHADAVVAILKAIGGSGTMQAAAYLVVACEHLTRPQEVIAKSFGANLAALAMETNQLVRVQRQARASQQAAIASAAATISASVRSWMGWGTRTYGTARPSALDCASAASANSLLARNTPTRPRPSRSAMSCTLHDAQLPQSASASMTTSQCTAISCRRSTGAGLAKVGLA